MVVREDIAVGRDNEAGPETLHLLRVCAVTEELAEERIVAPGRHLTVLAELDDIDADDGGTCGRDRPGDRIPAAPRDGFADRVTLLRIGIHGEGLLERIVHHPAQKPE